VGDTIRGDGLTHGGEVFTQWATIVEITPYDTSGCHSFVSGVEIPQRQDLLSFTLWGRLQNSTHHGIAPERTFVTAEMAQSPAREQTLALALAYQAVLSKAGRLTGCFPA